MSNTSDAVEGARRGTRERLIETAGQLFAARGFEGTTGKEISERAGVNPAAVNYHFGGLEGLYEAVLLEARERVIGREDRFLALLDAPAPFEEKLRAIITLVVKGVLATESSSWILRLFIREVTHTSGVGGRLLAAIAGPRVARVRAMIGELVGLDPDDPRVALACLNLAAPLQMLLIADRELVRAIHPALDLSSPSEAALIEHFHGFAMAGLMAMKARLANG